MAFCSNCGHEIPEGTKFCPNCGTPAGTSSQTAVNGDHAGRNDGANDQYSYYTPPQAAAHTSLSGIDRFGKYFGIILLILSFVDVISDPAILRIILAVVIIGGAIFCLGKKYKGKVLTIIALVLAISGLLSGFGQAKKYGLFKMPENEPQTTEAAAVQTEQEIQTTAAPETTEAVTTEESKTTEEPEATTEKAAESDKKTDGVDPELKAYLDSYEEFITEYVDFMNKYSEDQGSDLSMLAEYMDMLAKYEKFADRLDDYDTDDMSKADAAYYLDVMNRCNKKLLEIETN
ncbi:MAG: zinc-ribbon domain-containing protein [Lachnospiraceae bacterium]|nr:zinc-ribbon domain-containing protein [Lachnospiraceae bacterium]